MLSNVDIPDTRQRRVRFASYVEAKFHQFTLRLLWLYVILTLQDYTVNDCFSLVAIKCGIKRSLGIYRVLILHGMVWNRLNLIL